MARDAFLIAGVGVAMMLAFSGGSASAASSADLSKEAKALADHIADKGYDYVRQRVIDWQSKVGIQVDGHYGPETRASLARYGVENPPAALFVGAKGAQVISQKGGSTVTVSAPTRAANDAIAAAVAASRTPQPTPKQQSGSAVAAQLRTLSPISATEKLNLAQARALAVSVAAHIRGKGAKYTRSVVAGFQRVVGLKPDGLYGPATASALRYFGADAPAPIFKGVNAKYVPPTTQV